ncbi:MAG: prolyl oligopeptidase family serine peptidase [Gemmatimonadota bacterium]
MTPLFRRHTYPVLAAALLFGPAPAIQAQLPSRTDTAVEGVRTNRALSIDDYALWRRVQSVGLSHDGRWASFAYTKRETDDTLYVQALDGDRQHVIPRGSRAAFSDDGRWAAYVLSLPFAEIEKLEKEKKPTPRQVELLDLASGERRAWDNAADFAFADGGRSLVVKKGKADPEQKHDGTDLILRHLDKGYEELIGSVDEYAFNDGGAVLAYTVASADKDGNGLYVVELSTGARRPLDTDTLTYARLTWDEDGRGVAALKGAKAKELVERDNVLLAYAGAGRGSYDGFVYDPRSAAGFPDSTVISEKGSLTWSEDLSRVFVGTRPQQLDPAAAKKAAAGAEEEADSTVASEEEEPADSTGAGKQAEPKEPPVADVDIWHWRDREIQSVQRLRAGRERNRTYTAVVHLDGTFVPLADERMSSVDVPRSGRVAMGQDNYDYVHDWKPQYAEYYLLDTRTGERQRVLEKHLRTLGFSPDGEHFLYWKDGHIWDYALRAGEHRNLTADVPVSFVDSTFDRLGEKPPYGVAGYTKDGRSVILEHRFDLWRVPFDGGKARNLTAGIGSERSIVFRLVRLDPEERFVDLSEPQLLSAFGEYTKRDGFWRLEGERMRELTYGDVRWGRPTKARDTDRVLITRETFSTFPDVLVTDLSFERSERLTYANPQQDEFVWGRRLLFDYQLADGTKLQGTLAIPETYREGERLPMLVNYYEKYSQNLNNYYAPTYRSSPQFSGYVSNGYLVMQPDVHFTLGPSHGNMLEAVEAAVDRVVELGYADPARVGLHGHSYSGQGSAFISTRSKKFAAIVAGAAATNLVSDFNQLWKSAGTNQHRYDTYGQGRFATNPFDDLELYMDQSATFNARTMDTPLLQLHGTDDGSVEWLQAVEFYNALRFNGKNVILLSYPGEGHGLGKYENQLDFQKRMRQFFDHYLKGAPAPTWMTDGRTFLEKERALKAGGGGA